MHTLTVYPKSQPSLEEVKQFVQSFSEGDWVTGTGISRGVLESEDGLVYLDYDDHFREYFEKYLDEPQRAALARHLGFSPVLALHVQVSHAYQHSRELAQTVCESLVRRWGGDWGEDGKFFRTEAHEASGRRIQMTGRQLTAAMAVFAARQGDIA